MAHEIEDIILARRLLRDGMGEAIRRGAGLSLRELGALMDPPVPGSTVYRWERGATRPRADHAVSYLAVLRSMRDASALVEIR